MNKNKEQEPGTMQTTRFVSKNNKDIECMQETTTIQDQKMECIDQVISLLSNLLSSNTAFEFINKNDVLEVVSHFLRLFCIDDLNNFSLDEIHNQVDLLRKYLNHIVSECKDELLIDMRSVCSIFGIVGNVETNFGNSSGTLVWSSQYEMPVYLLVDKTRFPQINGTTLSQILNEIKNTVIKFRTIPEVMYYDYVNEKCNGLKFPTGLVDFSNPKNINEQTRSLINEVLLLEHQYPMFKSGQGPRPASHHSASVECSDNVYNNLSSTNTDDDCDKDSQDLATNHRHDNYAASKNHGFITLMGTAIHTAAEAYWKIFNIISDAMHTLTEYRKIHVKLCRILDLFNKSIIQTFNIDTSSSISNMLKKIIVMHIDLNLFEFARDLFVNQLKTDKLDHFSMERILLNISIYYINNSNPDKLYINVHEQQEQDIRITLMLFVYIFTHILSELGSFNIPVKFLDSISIPLIVGMSSRRRIVCHSTEIKDLIASNIVKYTSYNNQVLFEVFNGSRNNITKINDTFGNSFCIEVVPTSSAKCIICEK